MWAQRHSRVTAWDLSRISAFIMYGAHILSLFWMESLKQPIPLIDIGDSLSFAECYLLVKVLYLVSLPTLLFCSRDLFPYILAIVAVTFECLINYSSIAASHQFFALLALYFAVFRKASAEQREWGARINLSLVMFSAAIYKMNGVFLSGTEFLAGGDFYFAAWNLHEISLPSQVPLLVVGIELALAVLALKAGPRDISIYMFFILLLPMWGPLYLYSPLLFLPFFLNVCLKHVEISRAAAIPLFPAFFMICFVLALFQRQPQESFLFAFTIQCLILVCLTTLVGFWLIRPESFGQRTSIAIGPGGVFWSGILSVYLATGHLGWLPTPHAASMFSGRSLPRYQLDIYNLEKCDEIFGKYAINLWTVKFNRLSDRCRITHFFWGPLNYFTRQEGLNAADIGEVGG